MEIPYEIKEEILEYCRLNNIKETDKFIFKMIRQGYTVEKYGTSPIVPQVIEKEIIKEVEKIVEVPVEVIVEKEIIKEVIKEVEKIITDDKQVQELLDKVADLEVKLEEEKQKVSNSEINKLYQKISNLEALLELEKNRNKVDNKNTNPFGDKIKSAINWISKEDRAEKKDLYGE
jgi:hypothetical protein